MIYKYQLFYNKKLGVVAYAGTVESKIKVITKPELSEGNDHIDVSGEILTLFEKDGEYPRGQKIYYGDSCDKSRFYSVRPLIVDGELNEARKSIYKAENLMKHKKVFVD